MLYYRSQDISTPVGCRTILASPALPSDERTGQGLIEDSSKGVRGHPTLGTAAGAGAATVAAFINRDQRA